MKKLKQTKSLCPVCSTVLDAFYTSDEQGVHFEKECPVHGRFSVLAAENAALYERWQKPGCNIPPKAPLTATDKGCPFDCGPCAAHAQTACCIVIEVTQRCNQHCAYCYASSGEAAPPDPTAEEIADWYDFLIEQGEKRPFNLQFSGGEPTVRDDLPQLVKLAVEKGFTYLQLNTNGRRLAQEPGYAKALKQAGVSAVFLQFDGMNDQVNLQIRGEALLALKCEAIEQCRQARLPVALVPVVVRGINDDQIGALVRFASRQVDVIKGIHFQPVSYFGRFPMENNNRMTMFEVMDAIERQTDGLLCTEDLHPISTGHSMCGFYGTFLVEQDQTLTSTVKRGGAVQSAGCCDAQRLIAKDRDFVKDKWQLSEQAAPCCGDGLDAFLQRFRERSLTVTAMQFQDIRNLDLDRVRQCRVQVLTPKKTLVPFCVYNLTDAAGSPLYRR